MIQKGEFAVEENLYFNLYEGLANILAKNETLSNRMQKEISALIKMLAEIDGKVALNLTLENYFFFMQRGELDILNAACTHIDITDFSHLVKLSSLAVQFYVNDGSKDDGMIKFAKDLLKTVDRMFESAPERSKDFATAIKTNTDSTQEWHILNQY